MVGEVSLPTSIPACSVVPGSWALEWRRKLRTENPDPRMNLALTCKKAGRTDEAIDAYGAALEACPERMPSMESLAKLQLSSAKTDDRTPRMLDKIALRG